MIISIIHAGSICSPSSNTVHGLGTATVGALLVVVGVWAAITVVSSTGAVLVEPTSVVLVIIIFMITRSIRKPRSSAVHGLRATTGRALLVVVAVCAAITVVSSVGAVFVVPAPPVLVVLGVVVAWSVRIPRSSTIHRLSTTAVRALLVVVREWAAITVVSSALGVLVVPAPVVLVVRTLVVARSIRIPSSNTINWLRATRGRALHVVVAVRTPITIVSDRRGLLIGPAPPVLVVRAVMLAATITTPRSNTVHGLRATTLGTAHLIVGEWTRVSIGLCSLRDLVSSASLVRRIT